MSGRLLKATIFACLASPFGANCQSVSHDSAKLEALKKKASSLESTTDPIPCSRPADAVGWFQFVVQQKEDKIKNFDQAEACRLITAYADEVYGRLQKFWPLHEKIGLELTVKTDPLDYNASYNSNLSNPYYQPRLGLIYIAGVAVEPQKQVWAHEYGHAVLDEYVRKRLNQRYLFDRVIRQSAFNNDRNSVDLEAEIKALRQQSNLIWLKQDEISDRLSKVSNEQIKTIKTSNQLSELQRQRANTFYEIRSLKIDIRNAWMDISNMLGGNMDSYSEGKEILEADKTLRDDVPIWTKGFTPIINPDPVKINADLGKIASSKSKIAALMLRARGYPTNLDQQIQFASEFLDRMSEKGKRLMSEMDDRTQQRKKIDTQIAQMTVKVGLLKHERLVREGVKNIPGFSIYSYYHEFFADLFGAIFHDSPNGNGDALLSIMGPSMADDADARRFSPLHPERYDAKTWNPPSDLTHLFFTPVRARLGSDVIEQLNRQGKQKVFLKKALDFIAAQILDYTILRNDQLLLPYEPFVQSFSRAQSQTELLGLIDQAIKDSSLSSTYFHMQDLKEWCSFDFTACQQTIVAELKQGSNGAFSTSIKLPEANETLYRGLMGIMKEI